MKRTLQRLEEFRIKTGPMGSTKKEGRNGAFILPGRLLGRKERGVTATLILSDGSDWPHKELGTLAWEHASVSWPDRIPTWEEMSKLKDLLWNEHECVLQFHPPKSQHVNITDTCLHLWKPIEFDFPRPPLKAV